MSVCTECKRVEREGTNLFESGKFVQIVVVETGEVFWSSRCVLLTQDPLEGYVPAVSESTFAFVSENDDSRILCDFVEEVERFSHIRVIVDDDPLNVLK